MHNRLSFSGLALTIKTRDYRPVKQKPIEQNAYPSNIPDGSVKMSH